MEISDKVNTKVSESSKQSANGFIISATGSGCGKTTITAMILSAFSQRKLPLQPYKIGSDVFDCGLHCLYSSEVSLNLDTWIMGKKNTLAAVNKLPLGYRGLIEGSGGIFEHNYPQTGNELTASYTSKKQSSTQGRTLSSTMELAKLLNWPVVLIINCESVNLNEFSNIVSIVKKADTFQNKRQKQSRIAGVILNKVSNHLITDQLRTYLSENAIKVFGCVEKVSYLNYPSIQSEKYKKLYPDIKELSTFAEENLEITELLNLTEAVIKPLADTLKPLADTLKPLAGISLNSSEKMGQENKLNIKPKKRIAISDDKAFFFYYKDNQQFLIDHNVEIIEFSTLKDTHLPENLDGLILSGGIPEKYAKELTRNHKLREDIKNKIEAGLLCYAECGGMMFLSQGIYLNNKKFYPMIGAIPGIVELTDKLQNHGYALCKTTVNNKPIIIRGNEYHYARWLEEDSLANLWQTTTCANNETRREGYTNNNIHASFVHLYFPTASEYICNFFKLD